MAVRDGLVKEEGSVWLMAGSEPLSSATPGAMLGLALPLRPTLSMFLILGTVAGADSIDTRDESPSDLIPSCGPHTGQGAPAGL